MQILVRNIITNYKVAGKGKTLILLHGWGSNVEAFQLIFTELSQNYQVYALDLPGFGKTSAPPRAWSVDDYAEFVAEFLNKLEISHAIFLGHSFGGRILIKLATHQPELFEKLILTGAAGIKSKNHLRKNFFKISAKVGKMVLSLPGLESLQKTAKAKLYRAAGTDDYLTAGTLKPTFVKVTQEDLTPFLTKIKVKTLLIWGENDPDTPVREGKIMHAEIQNSEFKILAEAGHYTFLDQPALFLQCVNSFLRDRN